MRDRRKKWKTDENNKGGGGEIRTRQEGDKTRAVQTESKQSSLDFNTRGLFTPSEGSIVQLLKWNGLEPATGPFISRLLLSDAEDVPQLPSSQVLHGQVAHALFQMSPTLIALTVRGCRAWHYRRQGQKCQDCAEMEWSGAVPHGVLGWIRSRCNDYTMLWQLLCFSGSSSKKMSLLLLSAELVFWSARLLRRDPLTPTSCQKYHQVVIR